MKTILGLFLALVGLSASAQPVKYQWADTNNAPTVSNIVAAIADARALISTQDVSTVLSAKITNATNDLNTALTNRIAVSRLSIVGKVSDYTVTTNDYTVLVDGSHGIVNLTLPSAAACRGQLFVFKVATNNAVSPNDININSVSSQTFDAAAGPLILVYQTEVYRIQSDGTNWWIQ
jgi:hypothetical protein